MTTSQLDKLWKSIRGELEITANSAYFKAHIPGTYIKKVDEEGQSIEITSPSEFQKNYIESKLRVPLKKVLSKSLGSNYKIIFSVTKKEPVKIPMAELGPLFKGDSPENAPNYAMKAQSAGLNNRYTFKRFVVGTSNRLAYAVSTAIADNPGFVYNPFFLYSSVGLGKTHLIQAIGHEILIKHPEKTVLYKTGEQFLNEVINAVRRGRGSNAKRNILKKKYRNVDVLMIDDVHSIAGKETTQEEFFHTFNALYMSQKQIILTSDRAPHEIRTLEERLSSRFGSGMIADIQKPDVETRIAILKEKNEELNLGATDEIIEYISDAVDTNIRELEAKLLQTVTTAKSVGAELTKETAISIIGKIDKEKQRRLTPNIIIRETAKYYGVTIKDIKGKRRLKTLVIPRQVVMFLLRDMINAGFSAIGELVGGRDHSTILYGVNKMEKLIETNSKFRQEISQLKNNILVD